MTDFAILLEATGLTQLSVSKVLNVRHDTVRSYAVGRRNPPIGIMKEMVALAEVNMRCLSKQVQEIKEKI
jgi:predicted transcriptional regulator